MRSQTMSSLTRAIKVILLIWIVSAICSIPMVLQFDVVYVKDALGKCFKTACCVCFVIETEKHGRAFLGKPHHPPCRTTGISLPSGEWFSFVHHQGRMCQCQSRSVSGVKASVKLRSSFNDYSQCKEAVWSQSKFRLMVLGKKPISGEIPSRREQIFTV